VRCQRANAVHVSGGVMPPTVQKSTMNAVPPRGAMDLEWEDLGMHHVTIPLRDGYIVRPDGILVVRIRSDHSVGVHGIRCEDYLKAPWNQPGDTYRASYAH
jgi:hypothetical protein